MIDCHEINPNLPYWKIILILSSIRQEKDASDHTSIIHISQTKYRSIIYVPEIIERVTKLQSTAYRC